MVNHQVLRPGDIVGSTDTFTWLAVLERARINGPLNSFNPGICTHVDVITDRGAGLLYALGMQAQGIHYTSLQEYDNDKWHNHIVFVGRHKWLSTLVDPKSLNTWLIQLHAQKVKYDWPEFLNWLGLSDVNQDDKKMICSDLPRAMLKHFGVPYPEEWNHKCKPWDWQAWNTLDHVKDFYFPGPQRSA